MQHYPQGRRLRFSLPLLSFPAFARLSNKRLLTLRSGRESRFIYVLLRDVAWDGYLRTPFLGMIGTFITSEGESLKSLKQRMKLRGASSTYLRKVLLARIMRDRGEGRGVRG